VLLQVASQLTFLHASLLYVLRDMDGLLPSVLDPCPLNLAYGFRQIQQMDPSLIYELRHAVLNFQPL
jgi:hypothetical protein